MTKTSRVLLGLCSFLPLFFILLWCGALALGIYLITGHQQTEVIDYQDIDKQLESLFDMGMTLFILACFIYAVGIIGLLLVIPIAAASIFLIVYYIIHIVQNKSGIARVGWIVTIILVNVLVFPAYWWLYIKSERSPQKQLELPI